MKAVAHARGTRVAPAGDMGRVLTRAVALRLGVWSSVDNTL